VEVDILPPLWYHPFTHKGGREKGQPMLAFLSFLIPVLSPTQPLTHSKLKERSGHPGVFFI